MAKSINRRSALKIISATSAALLASPALLRAQSGEIVVAGPPDLESILRASCFPEFEAEHGCKILYDGANSLDNLRKLQAQRDRPVSSMVLMDDPSVMEGHKLGLIEPLDVNKVPNLSLLAPKAVIRDGAWANWKWSRASIAYNPKLTPGATPSWKMLWDKDLEKKVILPGIGTTTIALMLAVASHMESGKPMQEALYDLDAAFRKLAELKPNVLMFYSNTAQAVQLLEMGDVVYSAPMITQLVWPRKNAGAPVDLGFPEEGSFALQSGVAKVMNGPQPELADALVNALLSAKWQSSLIVATGDTPTNLDVTVPEGTASADQLITLDWEFIAQHRDSWMDRLQREISL